MKDLLNCPNCAAPVDPSADRCAYCGTYYPQPEKAAAPEIFIDSAQLASVVRDLDLGIITRNEARRRLGFHEV